MTDTRFDHLSVEREGLRDVADVVTRSENREKAIKRLSGTNGIINLVRTVDEETVAALPADCRIVARYGVGVDNTA